MPPTRTASVHDILNLVRRVERSGTERDSCDLCIKSNRRCIVDDSLSQRCAECIRHKKGRCRPGSEMPTNYESLERQQELLRLEEEKAFAQSQEINARILRLRKQQEFLRKREKEMIRRDLRTLEELDLAEENERLEKEKLEKERAEKETATAVTTSTPSGSSFGFFDPSLPLLSDAELEALLADVGTSGGMPVVSQGS
ncbi:hypothetical protein ACHAPC_009407 [Botrytis cinerea]|uniref:Uncharacterized protein n=2 Tax=Botryotinia fuckeliana (strain T4) TaxID=999810 RepID=G2YBT7_BOTF4|nr:hypothetical protein BofuT4_P100820.1 [Botrytis cinerea T4]CCD43015.1 hypothetical protein BofuT4_P070910.1 [Botrytis cinerea T4]